MVKHFNYFTFTAEIKLQFHVKWMTWWMELQFNLVVDMSVFLAYPFLKMMDYLPIHLPAMLGYTPQFIEFELF